MRLRPPARGRGSEDRGAVAVFVAIVLTLLMLVAALAVDLGMQRVARTDMQSLADVVALDLARELDGRDVATLAPLMPALADQARERNDGTLGETPDLDVELGSLTGTGAFVPMGAGVPTAVRVTASTTVGFVFGVADSGSATRSAVSTAQAGSCLRVGSYVARVDTTQSALLNPLLGGLLGSTVDLTAVGWSGLASADVTLAELVEVGGLGVGTVDELLALRDLSVGDFFLASARVLDAQGKSTEAALLRSIAVSAATPTIALGDLVAASPADPSALAARFNVLSLVQGAALLANRGHAVSLPGLSADIGIGTTTASLSVIEAPVVGCGPVGTTFETAQVRLDLVTHLDGRTVSVPALGTTVTLDPVDLAVSFDLGQAIATLTAVNCGAAGVESLAVALRSAVVGGLSVSASSRVRADFTVPLLGGSGVLGGLLTTILSTLGLSALLAPPQLVVDNTVTISGGSSGSSFTQDLTLPLPASYTTPVGSGSGALIGPVALRPVSASTVTLRYRPLLGGTQTRVVLSTEPLFAQTLTPILDQVLASVVDPLLDRLQTAVLTPLTQLLGVQYGGADVWAVPTPTCTSPKLVG